MVIFGCLEEKAVIYLSLLLEFSSFLQYIYIKTVVMQGSIWKELHPSHWDTVHYTEVGVQFACCYSVIKSCLTLCDPMDCSTPGFSVHHQLLELAQTHVHPVGDAIQPPHSLLPTSPLALSFSQHQGLSQWVSSSLRWPEYWSFNFSIRPSKEYSGLISFRIHWFDLLAVQGALKSLL